MKVSKETINELKEYFKKHEIIDIKFDGGNDSRCVSFNDELHKLKNSEIITDYISDYLIDVYDIPSCSSGYTINGTATAVLKDNELVIRVEYSTYDPEYKNQNDFDLKENFVNSHGSLYEILNRFCLDQLMDKKISGCHRVSIMMNSYYSSTCDEITVDSIKENGLDFTLEDIFYNVKNPNEYKEELLHYFNNLIDDEDTTYSLHIDMINLQPKDSYNISVTLTEYTVVEEYYDDILTICLEEDE